MRKILSAILSVLLIVGPAQAQFVPNQTLTAAELNSALASPTIVGGSINGAPVGQSVQSPGSFSSLSVAGPVSATTYFLLPAGTTSLSSLNIPQGAAPTTPNNGDVWTTSAGMFIRINGGTVGPLGGGAPSVNANSVSGNGTSGSAAAVSETMPSCSTAASALNWTTNGGTTAFSCNTAIAASTAVNLAGGSVQLPAILGIGIASSASTNLVLPAGSTTISSLRLPQGVAPTAPVNGDIWTTGSGMFMQIAGSTLAVGTVTGASFTANSVVAGNAASAITVTPTAYNFTSTARASGVAPYNNIAIPADTGITAGTEGAGFSTTTATRTWATTGTVALQRENLWNGPTYASASASQTFTDVFTGYFTPPVQGTNAIFTNRHTFGVIDGGVSAASPTTGGFLTCTTIGTAAGCVGIGSGNINAGGSITSAGAGSFGATTIAGAAATTALTLTQTARTSGVLPYAKYTQPADTGLTASTEAPGIQGVTNTRTWATTGTIALQREIFFPGPTYASASASQTFTDVFNMYLTPPVQGTNAIFTRPHTFGIVGSNTASSSITGDFVVATTLGTATTSVGIGGGNVNVGGVISGAAGVVGTPSLSLGGDTTTGWYRDVANDWAFSQSGVQKITLGASQSGAAFYFPLQAFTSGAPTATLSSTSFGNTFAGTSSLPSANFTANGTTIPAMWITPQFNGDQAYIGWQNVADSQLHWTIGEVDQSGGGPGTWVINDSVNSLTPFSIATNSITNAIQINTTGTEFAGTQQGSTGHVFDSATAPTIASGFGTSPSVPANNGTRAFTINVGTGGTATNGVVTMPAATNGWLCQVSPTGAPQAAAIMYSAPTSATSITITNYTASTGVALAWAASTVIGVTCKGY